MTRPAHKLAVIKSTTIPEHLLFVDTETTQTATSGGKTYQDLKLGVVIYLRYRRDKQDNQKEVYRFKTTKEFWDIAESRTKSKNILYLVAHNAVFDFTVLQHMTHLQELGYKTQFVYDGGQRFISKWRKDKKTIIILNNANWFAGKLEKWGKELSLPKLDMPHNLEGEDKWFTYCERDAEILYQLFMWYVDFIRKHSLGKWKFTLASGAMTAYRHRFMTHPVYIPEEESDSDIARSSYHGGRTECFRVGEYKAGTYYKLDINSMYPYVMRNYLYPTNFEGRYTDVPLNKLAKTLRKNCVIATVTLKPDVPYFCHTIDGRNVYPLGQFVTTLTTEELRLASDMEWIVKVHDACVYRARNIFTEYVDYFFRLKQEADRNNRPLLRSFAKLYLNSLYGKFGQRGYLDIEIGEDTEDCYRVSHGYNVRTNERFTLRQIGHKVLYSERGGESYNAFCAIASHVTASARLLLYDAIIECGRENVFYCDTDSIICNQSGFNRIGPGLDNYKLGSWKVEGISDDITIVAPKHYYFAGKWIMKGVRKNAKQLGKNQYQQEIWPGYNAILKTGVERYFNYQQIKTLSPAIVSGIPDGQGYVHPFIMKG